MTGPEAIGFLLERGPVRMSGRVRALLWVLTLLGIGALLFGLVLGEPIWSAEALLVATLIVSGVSQVGIVWSAVIQITGSRWGRSYRRLMELCLVGAPVAFLGLIVLFVFSDQWVPFAHQHLSGGKGLWLAVPFWAMRNIGAVLLLFLLSLWYLVHCLRPDLGLAKERGKAFPGGLTAWLTRDWAGAERELPRSERMRTVLAPILCIGYAVVYSMLGFDLVMALDASWYSTLFGAYHFTGNIYMGLAVAVLLAAMLRRRIGLLEFFSAKHFGILGAMLFAFCFLMGDFFWSQFLTIYYGNLPEETEYILLRTMDPELPWHYLAWAVLAGFFAIPFCALLFRAVKWVPWRVSIVAVVVVLAMVGERFLTTAPPLLRLGPGASLADMLVPLGLTVMASVGMLALGGLLYGFMMGRVPLLPLGDAKLADSLQDNEERS